MAAAPRGLGRGLDALLGGVKEAETSAGQTGQGVAHIPVASISPNPHQPRHEFDPTALEELSASIKAQGVLQPILVRPLQGDKFELVAGERRLRAATMAGLAEIPALVRPMTDVESLAIALIENLQREDLNAIEEAKGYRRLMDEFELSQEELARQVGKSRSALANALRLLNLPASIQQAIQSGAISAGHGRAVMSVVDESAQEILFLKISAEGMSVRQAEAEAAYYKEHGEFPVEVDLEAEPGESRPTPPKRQAKDPDLLAAQRAFAKATGLSVNLSGSLDRGKLVLGFTEAAQLREIAEKLGVNLG